MVTRRTARLACALLTGLLAGVATAQSPSTTPLAPTTRRAPDEFGTQDYTVTVIDATAFTADTPYFTDPGSLSRNFNLLGGHYFAGVNIPSGAIIDFIGLESYSGAVHLVATLFYLDRYSGTTVGIVNVASTTHRFFDSDYNPSAVGWQLARNVHNALVLDVYQPFGLERPSFGWVEIWWKRAVSPAPATATFNDVPMSDPQFQFIEAFAASGITAGCGGGNFCPQSSLTRGQMAVFLAKALGLHWPY